MKGFFLQPNTSKNNHIAVFHLLTLKISFLKFDTRVTERLHYPNQFSSHKDKNSYERLHIFRPPQKTKFL
ncbi:hypothetical protein SAMN05444274_105167 [Mariniphaga anaerophila]|uniref:Uncharacterized protein n=1 Tax=Mariniphaga anaerophila TaxID=1484053 RepID=A0A1M5BIS5_9BACT|nr:hypothetical protein SAMN05444274_105167 [Mariniphaga anaerophila]